MLKAWYQKMLGLQNSAIKSLLFALMPTSGSAMMNVHQCTICCVCFLCTHIHIMKSNHSNTLNIWNDSIIFHLRQVYFWLCWWSTTVEGHDRRHVFDSLFGTRGVDFSENPSCMSELAFQQYASFLGEWSKRSCASWWYMNFLCHVYHVAAEQPQFCAIL